MNPKKAKDLIPNVVQETGYSLPIVEAVVRQYWKEIWENTVKIDSPKIHIDNLGDLNIKHWILDKEIEKKKVYISKPNARMNYATRKKIEEDIQLFEKVKTQLEEEKQRKEFIHEHKRNKTDLEKQEGYIPGDIL